MVIEIGSDIFSDTHNLRDIQYLVNVFSDNHRYELFIEITQISDSELYQNLSKIEQEIILEYFNKFLTQSPNIDYKISLTATDVSFNIDEAKRFFNQPFLLILENNLNDSYFVDALLNNFKKRSKKIRCHKNNGWLIFDNGGGCDNIENLITGRMNQYANLPKDNNQYLRCLVLIDSDREFPNQQIKPSRDRLLKFLESHDIPYHLLEKREMENYIPDSVIDSVENNNDYIQAFLKLSPIQKDYFDIEKGFDNKNRNSFLDEIQTLYSNVSDSDFNILRKGLNFKSFKNSFPKLFLNENVNQDNLKSKVSHQTNPDELEELIDSINNLL